MDIDFDEKIILTGLILSFSLLSLVVTAGYTQAFDEKITFTLSRSFKGSIFKALEYFSYIGSSYVILPLSGLVMYIFYRLKEKSLSFHFGLMMISSLLSFLVLKFLFRRPRPEIGLNHPSVFINYSYPSGHTTGIFTLLLGSYVFYFLRYKGNHEPFLFSSLIVIASMVGISRIILGVHYLTDVIGGVLLSGIWITFFWTRTKNGSSS